VPPFSAQLALLAMKLLRPGPPETVVREYLHHPFHMPDTLSI